MHVYEVRPRKDHRGVDLISDALLFTTPSVIKPSYKNHKPYDGRPSDRESNDVSNVFAHRDYKSAHNHSSDASFQRGVDLISDALPFGRLWYAGPNAVSNAIAYAQFSSRDPRL